VLLDHKEAKEILAIVERLVHKDLREILDQQVLQDHLEQLVRKERQDFQDLSVQ